MPRVRERGDRPLLCVRPRSSFWQTAICVSGETHEKCWSWTSWSLWTDSSETLCCSSGTEIQLFLWAGQWQLNSGRLQGFSHWLSSRCSPGSCWQRLFPSRNISRTALKSHLGLITKKSATQFSAQGQSVRTAAPSAETTRMDFLFYWKEISFILLIFPELGLRCKSQLLHCLKMFTGHSSDSERSRRKKKKVDGNGRTGAAAPLAV